jgi:kumamolisin
MEFEVSLKMRSFTEFQNRLSKGEKISSEEMAEKYYPLESDYRAATNWLSAHGLTITHVYANRLAIFATGTISQVRQAFQVDFAQITSDGRTYISAVTAPSIPANLADFILGINGLQPHLRARPASEQAQALPGSTSSFAPPYLPAQIIQAYNATPVLGVTGSGQTIAIVMAAFPAKTDLTAFWSICGIKQSLEDITFVNVGSGPSAQPSSDNLQEATLDVEWSSAIAPGAKIRVYGTTDLGLVNLDQSYLQILSDLASHPGLSQVSLSYSGGEKTIYSTTQLQTDEGYFLMMKNANVTVFASSGDGGSRPFQSGNTTTYNPSATLQVGYPASDPSVTGVGGTSLDLNASNGNVISETVWSGSGGGVSAYISRPVWQSGTGVPGGNMRLVPDVACAADPANGAFQVLNGANTTVGGTSWSAPMWAGFCALINAARAGSDQSPVGLLGPQIYPLIGTVSFQDITSGSNGDYNAGVGYDLCTGIGTPNFAVLFGALANAPIITTQPIDQTAAIGAYATFTVAASSNPAPTYQWWLLPEGGQPPIQLTENATYSGVTTATLVVSNLTTAMSGETFTCVVSNDAGSIQSTNVVLTVVSPSTDLSLNGNVDYTIVGSNITLTTHEIINNSSTNPTSLLSLELWATTSPYFGGSITGDVLGNVSVTPLQAGYEYPSFNGTTTYMPPPSGTYFLTMFLEEYISGSYLLIPSAYANFSGSVTTATITGQPTNITVTAGQAANFTVGATGNPEPTFYQWQFSTNNGLMWSNITDGTSASGATTATLSINATVVAMSGYEFRCMVSNAYASPISNPAILSVDTAPIIMTQPRNQTATVGNLIIFTSEASGDPAPSFQWQFSTDGGVSWANLTDSGNLTGSATANLTLADVSFALNGDQFRIIATNAAGVTTSTSATLTVNAQPTITSLPLNQTLTAGQMATFTASASGSPAPAFQWQISTDGGTSWANLTDSGNLTGSATANLTLADVSFTLNGDQFRVIATNVAGAATSTSATLIVNTRPTITTPPSSTYALIGGHTTFTVAATGNPAPTYQWLFNGTPISGATSSTYTIPSVAKTNFGNYTVVISNDIGNPVISAPVTLTLAVAPKITIQPKALTLSYGTSGNLTLAATGTPAPTCLWHLNSAAITGGNVTGINNSTLLFHYATSANAGTYTVTVSNNYGSKTSNPVKLTVKLVAPKITTQPKPATVSLGGTANFSVVTSGSPTLKFQWNLNGKPVIGGNIFGATTTNLTITPVGSANHGTYQVTVSNAAGSAKSTPVKLTLQ